MSAEGSPRQNCVQTEDYTTEDFLAEVKNKQEFSSPAALLQITYHENISHDVKNREIH